LSIYLDITQTLNLVSPGSCLSHAEGLWHRCLRVPHPRAAEYPLPADAAPATTAAPDKVPASTGGASITLLDIHRDYLTRVTAEHWGTPAAASAFDADLVR
jgi:hypothetical protein